MKKLIPSLVVCGILTSSCVTNRKQNPEGLNDDKETTNSFHKKNQNTPSSTEHQTNITFTNSNSNNQYTKLIEKTLKDTTKRVHHYVSISKQALEFSDKTKINSDPNKGIIYTTNNETCFDNNLDGKLDGGYRNSQTKKLTDCFKHNQEYQRKIRNSDRKISETFSMS